MLSLILDHHPASGSRMLGHGLEKCINKRRHAGTGKENQEAEDQEYDQQGQKPPLLGLPQKATHFTNKSSSGCVVSGLFEFITCLFTHIIG